MTINKRQHGCDSLDCGDGTRIDIHMANNAGRGGDNVTLTRVAATVTRPAYTRQYKAGDIIAQTKTSGWRGKWSLTESIRRDLGCTKARVDEMRRQSETLNLVKAAAVLRPFVTAASNGDKEEAAND